MSATQVKNEIYEAKKLDALYQNILVGNSNGRSQDYEIRVDDFPVVGKNNDPERFMNYADFITPDTKYVSVLLYKNNGQSDKYFFHLQPNTHQRQEQLSGFDSSKSPLDETEVKEKMRKELHYEELQKQNEALRIENKEYEEMIESMEEQMTRIKANRDLRIEGIASMLLSGAMKSNFVKEKFPIISDLSGTEEKTDPPEKPAFKRKGEVDEPEEEKAGDDGYITNKERGYLLFLEDIRTRIGEVELANVMHLLDLVAISPSSISFAIKQVTNYIKSRPKEGEETNEKI